MTKEEMKDRISMVLKESILQQGFEIICKNLVELEKENTELKEKLEHRNCVDCSNHGSNVKLLKAREIIKGFLEANNGIDMFNAQWKAEQFLKEVDK